MFDSFGREIVHDVPEGVSLNIVIVCDSLEYVDNNMNKADIINAMKGNPV